MKLIKKLFGYRKNLKIFVPLLYLFLLLIGFLLYLITKIIPAFDMTSCLILGGQRVCTLVGLYLSTLVSLPGYIVIGSLLRWIQLELPVAVSYILVVFTNVAIYSFFGSAIQKLVDSKNKPDKLVTYTLLYLFVLLLAVFLILMSAQTRPI